MECFNWLSVLAKRRCESNFESHSSLLCLELPWWRSLPTFPIAEPDQNHFRSWKYIYDAIRWDILAILTRILNISQGLVF
jgi:hypothetical protein